MRLIWLLPLLLSLAAVQPRQDNTIPRSFKMMVTDALGRVYAIGEDEVFAFDPSGEERFRQSTKITGELSSVDPTSGMRILTYNADQNTVRFMDNTLSYHQQPLDLGDLGYPGAQLACASFRGNNFWIYDASSQSIVKVDESGEELTRTENLLSLVGEDFAPVQMLERNESLYLVDSSRGVWVFDQFGVFVKVVDATGAKMVQPVQNKMLWLDDKGIHAYSPSGFSDTLVREGEGIRAFCLTPSGKLWYSNDTVTFIEDLTLE